MKSIVVMFDTLRKGILSPYGCQDIITPNFQRLAEKTVRFENFYTGGLPCMPARREMHTGRYHFLHRGWGPVEPFDDSMPELLRQNGIYSHLVTDHKHYWRDGGSTYHTRYSSFEMIRGQEGDTWKGKVDKELVSSDTDKIASREGQLRKQQSKSQDKVNRSYMPKEADYPCARTVQAGLEFLAENVNSDNWFLQVECFDPHEPFFVPERFLKMYGIEEEFDGWVTYSGECDSRQMELVDKYYRALVTMCDEYLGKILDFMDDHDMWRDTMLIVNTDHGFMLGEHEWWGKNIMPVYNEIANIPFFIWDPRCGIQSQSRDALAQTIDIPATLLDFFQVPLPADMQGRPLTEAITGNKGTRKYALFGYFGSNINITDGRYVYMRAPKDRHSEGLYEYTLMPMRINRRFTPGELQEIKLHPPFTFTKGCQVLKIRSDDIMAPNYRRFGNQLYDCTTDPKQENLLADVQQEFHLIQAMKQMMKACDAPEEAYIYYGLNEIRQVCDVETEIKARAEYVEGAVCGICFSAGSVLEGYLFALERMDARHGSILLEMLKDRSRNRKIDDKILIEAVTALGLENEKGILYGMRMAMRES